MKFVANLGKRLGLIVKAADASFDRARFKVEVNCQRQRHQLVVIVKLSSNLLCDIVKVTHTEGPIVIWKPRWPPIGKAFRLCLLCRSSESGIVPKKCTV